MNYFLCKEKVSESEKQYKMPSTFLDLIISITAVGGFAMVIYLGIRRRTDPEFGFKDAMGEIKETILGEKEE